jgi:hypothetical protein
MGGPSGPQLPECLQLGKDFQELGTGATRLSLRALEPPSCPTFENYELGAGSRSKTSRSVGVTVGVKPASEGRI